MSLPSDAPPLTVFQDIYLVATQALPQADGRARRLLEAIALLAEDGLPTSVSAPSRPARSSCANCQHEDEHLPFADGQQCQHLNCTCKTFVAARSQEET